MERRKCSGFEMAMAIAVLLFAGVIGAQAPPPEVSAEPVPGQLDIMQGTAIKLGGAAPTAGPQPESYKWEVVQGRGGTLLNGDSSEAIFQAPVLTVDLEVFVIRLTVVYPGGETASNSVHLRVHRDRARPKSNDASNEKAIEDVMTDYYRREEDARERNRRRNESGTVVIHQGYSGFHGGFGYRGPGWGWGYGWGWPAAYPVFAPVVIPPPGVEWRPGVGDWREPVAIPYDELTSTFPGDIADDYVPGDFPGSGGTAEGPTGDDIDTSFIVPPPGEE